MDFFFQKWSFTSWDNPCKSKTRSSALVLKYCLYHGNVLKAAEYICVCFTKHDLKLVVDQRSGIFDLLEKSWEKTRSLSFAHEQTCYYRFCKLNIRFVKKYIDYCIKLWKWLKQKQWQLFTKWICPQNICRKKGVVCAFTIFIT